MGSRAVETLRQIARRFPSTTPTEMSFAYGSGVFHQSGQAPITDNMIDLCLVVDATAVPSWHEDNLRLNHDDYSFVRRFGPEKITALQESPFGAKVRVGERERQIERGKREKEKHRERASESRLDDAYNRTLKPFGID